MRGLARTQSVDLLTTTGRYAQVTDRSSTGSLGPPVGSFSTKSRRLAARLAGGLVRREGSLPVATVREVESRPRVGLEPFSRQVTLMGRGS